MAVEIDHLRTVKYSEAPCDDMHEVDLGEFADEYREHEAYLTDRLGQDVAPENVFMGGEIYTFPRLVIESDEYSPAPSPRGAFAAVELWAADKTAAFRVHKIQDGNGGLIRRLTEDRLSWMPGMPKRRARQLATLASSILSVPRLHVAEFARPDEPIDDAVLGAMRTTDMERTYLEEYRSDTGQTLRSNTSTGHDLFSGRPYPEAYTTIDESRVSLLAATYGDARQEPSEQSLAEKRVWLAHWQGHELATAVNGLRRAARAVRHGEIITPSTPQNTVRIYHPNDW